MEEVRVSLLNTTRYRSILAFVTSCESDEIRSDSQSLQIAADQ